MFFFIILSIFHNILYHNFSLLIIFSKNCKTMILNMFVYTEKYIESHRNIQNINIYHKHTQNTKFDSEFDKYSKKTYSSKIRHSTNHRFMQNCMASLRFYIFIILVHFYFGGKMCIPPLLPRPSSYRPL